jgi:hypothetical protein
LIRAPFFPHSTKGRFKVHGKARSVKNWGGKYLRTESRAQVGQALEIAGVEYCTGDIVVWIASDPVGQPGVHQKANALAGQKVLA